MAISPVEKIFVVCRPSEAGGVGMADRDAETGPPSINLLWRRRRASAEDAAVAEEAESSNAGAAESREPNGDRTRWPRELYSLVSFSPGTDKEGRTHVLVGWLTGEGARAVSGRPSEVLLPELERGLAHVWRVVGWQPLAVHATSWAADPFIGGGYSFPTPEAHEDVADALAAPLCAMDALEASESPGDGGMVPRVLFCGEATSRAHFGTVHGAIISGEREAARLLRAWRKSDCELD
eukprot:5090945-Prymnesium_polylepis.1